MEQPHFHSKLEVLYGKQNLFDYHVSFLYKVISQVKKSVSERPVAFISWTINQRESDDKKGGHIGSFQDTHKKYFFGCMYIGDSSQSFVVYSWTY